MQTKAIIEALLFVRGEPISLDELARLIERPREEVARAVEELAGECAERGLVVMQKDGAVQMGSHPDAHEYIERLTKSEFSEGLSRSALETLAIVAYKGPLSRVAIDYIRGVNSSFTLRNLLMRGLVERVENSRDSRSYQYRASFELLQHFGLASMSELPEYENLRSEEIQIAEETKNNNDGDTDEATA